MYGVPHCHGISQAGSCTRPSATSSSVECTLQNTGQLRWHEPETALLRRACRALQGFLQKLGHVLSGPSESPTTKHYKDAKAAAGTAYDHAGSVSDSDSCLIQCLHEIQPAFVPNAPFNSV